MKISYNQYPNVHIKYWQDKLRLLQDWEIQYDETLTMECEIYPELKRAKIGKYLPIWMGEVTHDLHTYIFHECCHIAISAIRHNNDSNSEEVFVQDLCKLINFKENE